MNNRKKGTEKEAVAEKFLRENGMHIIEKNFRCRQAEIDLIGKHSDYLVFVEVKYRKNNSCGFPEEAVNQKKQRKISNAARVYLYQHKIKAEQPIRFDVVAICGEQLRWYQNAFEYGIGY